MFFDNGGISKASEIRYKVGDRVCINTNIFFNGVGAPNKRFISGAEFYIVTIDSLDGSYCICTIDRPALDDILHNKEDEEAVYYFTWVDSSQISTKLTQEQIKEKIKEIINVIDNSEKEVIK